MHDVPSIVNAAGKGKPEPTKFVVPSANPSKAPVQYFSFTIKFKNKALITICTL